MANILTNNAAGLALDALVNGSAGLSLKYVLLLETYTPDQDHAYADELTAHELVASGYVGGYNGAGRKAITSPSVVVNDADNLAYLTADDATWLALGTSEEVAYVAIISEVGGSDATSPIIAILDGVVTLNGGDLVVSPAAAQGLLRINC